MGGAAVVGFNFVDDRAGVAVGEAAGGKMESFVETTGVEFVPLPDEWIESYIAAGEHRDSDKRSASKTGIT